MTFTSSSKLSDWMGRLPVELPSLGTVLRDPLWVLPSLSLPLRACFHLASASPFLYAPGRGRVNAGLPPWGALFPLPTPPPQALCEILLRPPPEWGWPSLGGMRSHLRLSMKDSLQNQMQFFNLRARFEEFGYCDCLWSLCMPRRFSTLWGFWNQKWKNRWINEPPFTNPSSWSHNTVSGSNQKCWQDEIPMHKCDPQMGLVVFVTFCKAFFYIYFRAQFFNVSLVNKCISEYIYSQTIHIFEVEPYECQ